MNIYSIVIFCILTSCVIARDDLECRIQFGKSSASRSCFLLFGYPKFVNKGCKIGARCYKSAVQTYGTSRESFAQPYLHDVPRLVNCNGYLEYDRC